MRLIVWTALAFACEPVTVAAPCETPADIETARVRLGNQLRQAGYADLVDAHEAALDGETPRPWPRGTGRWAEMKRAKEAVAGALSAGGGGSFVSFDCDEDPCLVSVRGRVAQDGRDAVIAGLAAAGASVRPKGKASQFKKPEVWVWTFPVHMHGDDVFARSRAQARLEKAHAEARHAARPPKEGF